MAENRSIASESQAAEKDLAASMLAVDLNHEHGETDKQTPSMNGPSGPNPNTNGNAPEECVPGDEPADHPDDEDYGEMVDLPPPEQRKKKKRKKTKPKSQRGLVRKAGTTLQHERCH